MKRLFAVALGILTAIGGFVDIGDIVANTETGARFGMSLAWVVAVGVIGICLFAEMAGRVATVSKRAAFDLVRERLGAPGGAGQPGGVVLHHLPDPGRRDRRGRPYEAFFFSSGAVEEGWSRADLVTNRLNVYIGFPLGGLLSLSLMAGATLFLEPRGIQPGTCPRSPSRPCWCSASWGWPCCWSASSPPPSGRPLRRALSCGYTIAQYFGFQWGKFVRPADAPGSTWSPWSRSCSGPGWS